MRRKIKSPHTNIKRKEKCKGKRRIKKEAGCCKEGPNGRLPGPSRLQVLVLIQTPVEESKPVAQELRNFPANREFRQEPDLLGVQGVKARRGQNSPSPLSLWAQSRAASRKLNMVQRRLGFCKYQGHVNSLQGINDRTLISTSKNLNAASSPVNVTLPGQQSLVGAWPESQRGV